MTFPNLDEDYPVNNFDTDRLILTESSNCKRYAGLGTSVKKSKEWDELFNTRMSEKLEPNLYEKLRQETGYSDYGT